jgi:hypothetical protein
MSVVAAIALPESNPGLQAATSSTFKETLWVFDFLNHGHDVTSLSQGSGVSFTVKYKPNTEDYGNAATPISAVTVIDPFVTGETDLQQPANPDYNGKTNKSLILNDETTIVNDTFRGGDFVFLVKEGNIRKVNFDLIDVGDEQDGIRFNNQYVDFYLVDGTKTRLDLNSVNRLNYPDKHVINVLSPYFNKNVASFVVHISGSGALDNLNVFTTISAPTSTPPTLPTNVPTATPTARPTATPTLKPTATPTVAPSLAPVVCKERKTVTYFNNEMLAAGTFNRTTRTTTDETRSKLPSGITLTNQTSYNVNLADSGKFVGDPNNVRFKYDVNVIPMWGWRGDVNAVKKQTNEAHRIQIKSGSRVLDRVNCLDWGNAKNYTDGVGALQSVESSNPISNSPYFQLCLKRAGSNPVTLPNNGKISIRPEQIVNKAVSVKATHITNQENFDNCVANNNGNKPICRGSHYSLVKVDYCVREGR